MPKTEKRVCIKTLYNYIHAQYLPGITLDLLPYARKQKKKYHKTAKRKYARGRSIEERPKAIKNREEYGHWEMDTVYSSKDDKACLLVLSERKTRAEVIIKMPNRTSQSVIKALDKLERQMGAPAFREKFRTITCDNGVEFSDWKSIERSSRNKKLKRTVVYFCHPYASWERGTNENINRMIRRWIPKGDDIGLYSDFEIRRIQDWINNYPRGIHGGKSAAQYLYYM